MLRIKHYRLLENITYMSTFDKPWNNFDWSILRMNLPSTVENRIVCVM